MTDVLESVDEANRQMVATTLIMWVSALVSTVLDNIPWTAVMVQVVERLGRSALGLEVPALAWSLSLGACLGGNGSLIGASANVVMVGIADKRGWHISFWAFTKVGFPILLASMVISNAYLLARYP